MKRKGKCCIFVLPLLVLLGGCVAVGNQVVPVTTHQAFTLKPAQLQEHGVALLTPSIITGQEQDRQSLALIAAQTIHITMPTVRVVTLSETLGAVNTAGLADVYRQMYEVYDQTGLFRREALQKVGQATGVRYLAQLKLAGFTRDTRERLSIFGFRVFQTLHANVRLYIQIWDSTLGVIAWEATGELNHAYDSLAEKPVTFRLTVEEAVRQLLKALP